jgi:hypothetical protein
MSRVFTDDSLLTWEAFASGGPFGLPRPTNIIFQCLSDPDRRARYVRHEGNNSSAERAVNALPDAGLLGMLQDSVELD